MSDTNDALSRLFDDPAFLSVVQGHTFNPSSLYTQLLTNMLPSYIPNTPIQQTRSGRISRPPIILPQHPLLQTLAGEDPGVGLGKASLDNGEQIQDETTRFWRSHQTGTTEKLHGIVNKPDPTLAGGRKRSGSTMEEEDDLNNAESDTPQPNTLDESQLQNELPPYPLPPSGPNSRKSMPRDELLARRRARNRVAAVESRKKKKVFMGSLEERLKEREDAYDELERHCQGLEQEVQHLKAILATAGLAAFMPVHPVSYPPQIPLPLTDIQLNMNMNNVMTNDHPSTVSNLPVISLQNPLLDETPMTMNETPIPTFDMFFNLDDMDGEHDADFLPTSSPKHETSGESEREEATPASTISHKRHKRKGKRKTAVREEDEDEDDFVDPEVEDEDLFLPIEDVPIPEDLKQDAMKSLGVDNQTQLVNLINKMVNAGQEGMTSETVEKLKVLLTLVGPQGGWSG